MRNDIQAALNGWWNTNMRHGETASEMAKSLAGSLHQAGFVIVPASPSDDALMAAGDPYSGRLGSREQGLELRRNAWQHIIDATMAGK